VIRTVVVDDERLARDYLRSLLSREPDVALVGECEDVEAALAAVKETKPDLLLLDVQLRRATGFDLLEQLEEPLVPWVVFVTAFDEHAVRAFEVHALDYLLKPFDGERLRVALDRVRERMAARRDDRAALAELVSELRREARAAQRDRFRDRFMVTADGRSYFIPVSQVEWIDASHNHIVLHVGEREHRLRVPLSAVQGELDPWRFVRIHRSTIVNVDFVAEVQPWYGGDSVIIMRRGQRLRVGRSYRDVWDRWKAGARE
jgi:two-component system LytT family response regulator